MVKLAIRDDDANFFTKVEDIEFVYKDFEGFPISFAVVPHVMDVSTKGTCSDTKGNTTPRDIDKNIELCLCLEKSMSVKSATFCFMASLISIKLMGIYDIRK